MHLGKLSCLTTSVHRRHFFLHPGPSSLRPTEEIKKQKTKPKYRNYCPSHHPLAAIPWLGKQDGHRGWRSDILHTPRFLLCLGGSTAIRPRSSTPACAKPLATPADTSNLDSLPPLPPALGLPLTGAAVSGSVWRGAWACCGATMAVDCYLRFPQ